MVNRERKNPVVNALRLVLKTAVLVLVIIPAVVIALPFFIVGWINGLVLRLEFRHFARREQRFVLWVDSDSAVWRAYVDANILPHIRKHAVMLNWSERGRWDRRSWAARAFHHWGGRTDFNPMAIVFCPPLGIRSFRFYRAFQDYKHGKSGRLQRLQAELLELVREQSRDAA